MIIIQIKLLFLDQKNVLVFFHGRNFMRFVHLS